MKIIRMSSRIDWEASHGIVGVVKAVLGSLKVYVSLCFHNTCRSFDDYFWNDLSKWKQLKPCNQTNASTMPMWDCGFSHLKIVRGSI